MLLPEGLKQHDLDSKASQLVSVPPLLESFALRFPWRSMFFYCYVSVCNSCLCFWYNLIPRRGIWGVCADGAQTTSVKFSIFVWQV